MKETKIQLSQREMELMCDAEVLFAKNRILGKVKALLEMLQGEMTACREHYRNLPEEVWAAPPKISRGENYLGLPYMVLDYPRRFAPGAIFAVRSFFWWGNFYSTTLHLSGDCNGLVLFQAERVYERLRGKGFYLGIGEDPWVHHFDPSNYMAVDMLNRQEFAEKAGCLPHIKIATMWPLAEWHFAAEHFWESWKLLLELVNEQETTM